MTSRIPAIMATLPRPATDGARLVEHLAVLDGKWPSPLPVREIAEIVLADGARLAYVAGRTPDGRLIYTTSASKNDKAGSPQAINYACFVSVGIDAIVDYRPLQLHVPFLWPTAD